MAFTRSLVVAILAGVASATALPSQMKAVQASGTPCEKPDWPCISENTVNLPRPGAGQMLVAMRGASVNPINVDLVEPLCRKYPPSSGIKCSKGTIGNDGAGVVVELGGGDACEGFRVNNEVWMFGGQYAEYAVIPCAMAGLKPKGLGFLDAATIPVVGVTSLQCLQAAGTPLTNLTVVVTSGQGGTGFIGVQLAKALGASHVITAATGDGIQLMKTLGADTVIDYHKQDLFDALPDDSVDVVYDNFGTPGTADKAMHAIRSGGVFMILFGGNGGQISDHPKAGVRQVSSCRTKQMGTEGLDTLASFFDAGKLQPHTMSPVYGLSQVPQAFTRLLGHGVLGKIAIMTTKTSVEYVASPLPGGMHFGFLCSQLRGGGCYGDCTGGMQCGDVPTGCGCSAVPSRCPGGSLKACMEQCPLTGYKTCVQVCSEKCPKAEILNTNEGMYTGNKSSEWLELTTLKLPAADVMVV